LFLVVFCVLLVVDGFFYTLFFVAVATYLGWNPRRLCFCCCSLSTFSWQVFSWCLVVVVLALPPLWWCLIIDVSIAVAHGWFSKILDSLIVPKYVGICRILCLWLTCTAVSTDFQWAALCFFLCLVVVVCDWFSRYLSLWLVTNLLRFAGFFVFVPHHSVTLQQQEPFLKHKIFGG
jgi:hypothetical protein